MIRSPMRRHHHHRSKSPTRRSPKHEREREREHRSSHSAKEKRSHEEENGRHHHHHRRSREQEHVKERSHREKDSSTERSRDREEVSVDRRRNSTSRGEHDKDRHVKEREEKRSKRNRSQSPPMDSNRSHVRPTSPVSPSRRSRSRVHDEVSSPRGDEHRNEDDSVAKMKAAEEALEAKKKEEPSFELSGKLAEETNRVRGVALLFTEPPDARKPDIRWRLYVFKAGEVLNEPLYIHRQSCYLFGRERRVADVPTDHPSCSKQHAVIQFRLVEKELPDGMLSKQSRVRDAAREFSLIPCLDPIWLSLELHNQNQIFQQAQCSPPDNLFKARHLCLCLKLSYYVSDDVKLCFSILLHTLKVSETRRTFRVALVFGQKCSLDIGLSLAAGLIGMIVICYVFQSIFLSVLFHLFTAGTFLDKNFAAY